MVLGSLDLERVVKPVDGLIVRWWWLGRRLGLRSALKVWVVPMIAHIIVVVIRLLLGILHPRLKITIRLAGIVVARSLSAHDGIPLKGNKQPSSDGGEKGRTMKIEKGKKINSDRTVTCSQAKYGGSKGRWVLMGSECRLPTAVPHSVTVRSRTWLLEKIELSQKFGRLVFLVDLLAKFPVRCS